MAIDEFCKQLARANPGALAQWLLDVSGVGEPAGGEFLGVGDDFADGPAATTTTGVATAGDSSLAASAGSIAPAFYWQLIDTELAAESHRADTVILQAAPAAVPGTSAESAIAAPPEQLLHLEFQSRPDRHMPERMLEYWIRLWRLHRKPIRQVVLYLRKTKSSLVQVDELQVGETRHRYGVVRLWEQDPLPLLQNPALLPLATLARPVIPANNKASKKGNESRTANAAAAHLALVAERVAAIRNPVLQKEIAGGCHLLAGLVFSQELINAYFTMGILDDSVTYQAAVAEYTRRGRLEGLAEGERHGEQRGHQLGHQQGLSQGRHQGLKEGELQGKQQEAQALVMRQLPRRCGQLS